MHIVSISKYLDNTSHAHKYSQSHILLINTSTCSSCQCEVNIIKRARLRNDGMVYRCASYRLSPTSMRVNSILHGRNISLGKYIFCTVFLGAGNSF